MSAGRDHLRREACPQQGFLAPGLIPADPAPTTAAAGELRLSTSGGHPAKLEAPSRALSEVRTGTTEVSSAAGCGHLSSYPSPKRTEQERKKGQHL